MVDEMLQPDGSTILATYSPSTSPYNDSTPGYSIMATFEGTIAYKCRDFGIWLRGEYLLLLNSVALDNTKGVLSVPGPAFITNAYIVGETDNLGYIVDYWGMEPYGRARPVVWTNNMPIQGIG